MMNCKKISDYSDNFLNDDFFAEFCEDQISFEPESSTSNCLDSVFRNVDKFVPSVCPENSTTIQSGSEQCNSHPSCSDINYALFKDDDFPIDAISEMENRMGPSCLSTPPDSIYINAISCTDHQSVQPAVKGGNSRERILQALNLNKNESALPVLTTTPSAGHKRKVDVTDETMNRLPSIAPNKKLSPGSHGAGIINTFQPFNQSTRISPGNSSIQKRKFPGPAGLLLSPGASCTPFELNQSYENTNHAIPEDLTIGASQVGISDFSCEIWQKMLTDLGFDERRNLCPVRVFNLGWVLQSVGGRGVTGVRKIPFLAVFIQSLDLTHMEPTAILRDKTGEMSGTVAMSVITNYSAEIQPGALLVLHNVTVLSPFSTGAIWREQPLHHYLNITVNTIVAIHSLQENGTVLTTRLGILDQQKLQQYTLNPHQVISPKVVPEVQNPLPSKTPLFSHQLHRAPFRQIVPTGVMGARSNSQVYNQNSQMNFQFRPIIAVRSAPFSRMQLPHQSNCFNNFSKSCTQRLGSDSINSTPLTAARSSLLETNDSNVPAGTTDNISDGILVCRTTGNNLNATDNNLSKFSTNSQNSTIYNSTECTSFRAPFRNTHQQILSPNVKMNSNVPAQPVNCETKLSEFHRLKSSLKLTSDEQVVINLLEGIDEDMLFGEF